MNLVIATGYFLNTCDIHNQIGFQTSIYTLGVCRNSYADGNSIETLVVTNSTVTVYFERYASSDRTCSGPVQVRGNISYPSTCASHSASVPFGAFFSYYNSTTECAIPDFQVGFVDGVCYKSFGNSSVTFHSCGASTTNGVSHSYFTNTECSGPFLLSTSPPTTPGCHHFPSNQTYARNCYAPPAASLTVSPTSGLSSSDEALCYQASLQEYTFPFNALGSGTGTATIETFVASSEIRVNVTFTGLSSPTYKFPINLYTTPTNDFQLHGLPFNVTSGFYSNTTTVNKSVFLDLISSTASATEKARLIFSLFRGMMYGEFSPCAQVTTTSFTAAKTTAQRLAKSLRAVALDEAVSKK